MESLVVPNCSCLKFLAKPILSLDNSSKLGTMRAPVAMASNSI
jgi:hypothetical protein